MRLAVAPLVLGAILLAWAANPAAAGKCGKADCSGCQQPSCGCGVEIQYEERKITLYKTVFEEIKEKKEVPAVKYVPEKELRDVPMTVPKPAAPEGCGAPAGCGEPTSCCQAQTCCPETCIRKVPVTVYRAVPDKKIMETVRIVEKKVPYTVTCYVPKPCCGPKAECAPAPCGGK